MQINDQDTGALSILVHGGKWEIGNLQTRFFLFTRCLYFTPVQMNTYVAAHTIFESIKARKNMCSSSVWFFGTYKNTYNTKRMCILTKRLLSSSTVVRSWENSLNDWAEIQRHITATTPHPNVKYRVFGQ